MSDKGVYRLAGAMLLQAIQDAGSSSVGRRTGALRWMCSKETGCFSFVFVCRVLGRNPVEVRRFCERKAAERRRPEITFHVPLKEHSFAAPPMRM
jgi:hypothetical protein